jgi:hypothetical protein
MADPQYPSWEKWEVGPDDDDRWVSVPISKWSDNIPEGSILAGKCASGMHVWVGDVQHCQCGEYRDDEFVIRVP